MYKVAVSMIIKHRYSFIAGACAAGGSFFGKLPSFLTAKQITDVSPTILGVPQLDYALLHLLPFALMIICNVLNWRFFLKALATVDQTLTATVLTAASNYMLSFVLGCTIYQEHVTLLSALGSTLIIAGLWFLCDVPSKQTLEKSQDFVKED